MGDGKIALWAVAEYRGVAICNRDGGKPKVMRGKIFYTDGNTYLIERNDDKRNINWHGFVSERIVKEVLDKFAADGLSPSRYFLSMLEVLKIIGADPRNLNLPSSYVWDEAVGMFVRSHGLKIGHHRYRSTSP